MDIAAIRTDYRHDRLRREDLQADPIRQFELWLQEACDAGVIVREPDNSWSIHRLAP